MKVLATSKKIKKTGRILMDRDTAYLNYSCSSLEFECVSDKVSVRLWTNGENEPDIMKAVLVAFINGKMQQKFMLKKEEADYVLYEGKVKQNLHIKLMKLSEASCAKVGVKFFDIQGEIAQLIHKEHRHKIEFIGDSITCGYGIEGGKGFATWLENPLEAYCARAARKLDAEFQIIAWSGIGIMSSYTETGEPRRDWLMPMLYPYTDLAMEKLLGHSKYEEWNFNKFKPDCIVINLGTNDESCVGDSEERLKTFGASYYNFLKHVRCLNPKAMIICTLGVKGQQLFPEINKQAVRFSLMERDERIVAMPFEEQDVVNDGVTANYHPSKLTHEKMAKQLVKTIREVMKWEE